jgi:small subunit ribosomal protein S1
VVSEVVKGGLSVDVGVRAFMPASRSGAKDAAELEKLVGQEIQCRIIELDVSDEDVVVDRRSVLEEEGAKARQKVFDDLQEGAVVQGTVRSLTQFGAFVDIGAMDGLLHVADMAWGRVKKPSDVVSEGASVEVKILKIDRGSRRVSLGLKQLQPDPWTLTADNYKTGQRVKGRISRLADFGAFVELEPGVEGLIHLSEMSWSKKSVKAKDIVKPGEFVEVVVLGVNPAERRIALGLKQALGDPWDEVVTKFQVGSTVEGPVVSLTNFGAFIEMGDGVEGMIHIGDITREKRLKHPKEALNPGQRVKAAVVEVDREKRRIRLSIKQLEPTTADEYIGEHKSGDVVSGRVVDVGGGKARVELGEGVYGTCRLPVEAGPKESTADEVARPDLGALTAMLSAKWKQGRAPSAASGRESAKAGQIRSFRILSLDSGTKKIELELAS